MLSLWPSSWFSARASTPSPPGVRTVPCTGMDVATRDMCLTTGLVINARLDAKILGQRLSTLVERKFPRAGARIALRNGVYEFQIPRAFDSSITPAIAFTVDDYPEPYRSPERPELPTHILGRSPKPSACPLPALDPYFKSSECPTTLDGFLVPNTPLLHAHVAVFADLTFIGLSSSHLAFDGIGTRTLLHAWTRLLNGEDIDTIPGMEWDAAPFETFRVSTPVAHARGWFDLGLFSMLLFVVRMVLRLLWDSQEVNEIVRVPKAFLEDSKREIMKDLKLQESSEYVGSSDVLMAWWFKTIYSHRKVNDTTPIHIHMPVDLREKSVFPGESTISTPYIHNAVSAIAIPPIPVNAFQSMSLGELALRIRRAILAYNADLEGIRADLVWRCSNPLKVHFPCSALGEYSFQTSWRSAHYETLDFSGACKSGEGKPRVVLALALLRTAKNIPMRGMGAVLMDEDSVWMSQVRGKKDWEEIRRNGVIAFIP
ncbi:hypothetical protein C8J57DRAFT_1299201 [Mycena rebaudengoi]|nr:hypothetical protein C8J57DRAFT_1299201 [Mycena rebaudengoi]